MCRKAACGGTSKGIAVSALLRFSLKHPFTVTGLRPACHKGVSSITQEVILVTYHYTGLNCATSRTVECTEVLEFVNVARTRYVQFPSSLSYYVHEDPRAQHGPIHGVNDSGYQDSRREGHKRLSRPTFDSGPSDEARRPLPIPRCVTNRFLPALTTELNTNNVDRFPLFRRLAVCMKEIMRAPGRRLHSTHRVEMELQP